MPANPSLEGYTEAQREQLARTAHQLLSSPEVSRETKRLLKKIDPNLQFPDVDMDERFEAFKQEQANKEREREERERVSRSNAEWESACKRMESRGFKVDDVKKVMTDRGILNPDTAMDFMANEAKLAEPTPDSLSYTLELPEHAKEIAKDPNNWAKREAHKVVSEIMRSRAA